MANQVDNITLVDPTSGLPRTITASDDLFLSVDLTLNGGALLVADNLKRGATDPNGAVAGNIGDILVRTDNGLLYVNTDGTITGWQDITTADTLAETLTAGNTSGGTNLQLSIGDSIVGTDNAVGTGGDLTLTAGSSGGGGGSGGNIVLNPGAPAGGANGVVFLNGMRHYPASAADPTSPAPAAGDIYFNTALQKEMRFDGSRSKWLTTEIAVFQFGRSGNTGVGAFYRGINGSTLSGSRGWPALYDGTVVGLSYSRSDTDAATFEITEANTTVASLASSAVSGFSTTLDGDFSAGSVLSARNAAGGNTTNAVQAWCHVKWRA